MQAWRDRTTGKNNDSLAYKSKSELRKREEVTEHQQQAETGQTVGAEGEKGFKHGRLFRNF